MASSVIPPPSTAGNGTASLLPPETARQAARPSRAPRSPLLARLTGLTSIATVTAVGIIIVGVLAVIGGNYDKQVIHDQLAPQKIYFPKPATYPDLAKYAGQQVLSPSQAKAYAGMISSDMNKIAGGKTYSEVSAAAIKSPTNKTLEGEKTALFEGNTLRGLLLNAWGWGIIGTIALIAGILLIVLGIVLLLLPLANWRVNLRGGRPSAAGS